MFQLLLVLHLKLKLPKLQNHLMTHQFLQCIHVLEGLQSAGNISSADYNSGCLYLFESRIQIKKLIFKTGSKWTVLEAYQIFNQL